jgi:hypothetical protein
MPHRGAGNLRTPRHIALDKGTAPGGFPKGVDYCAVCGHALGGELPHGHYEEQGPSVKQGSAPQKLDPMKLGR